jgi:uncharacterized Zn-finger protein
MYGSNRYYKNLEIYYVIGFAVEAEQRIITKQSSVSCDGGGGPLGHPRVYLQIGDEGDIVCPYCSCTYKLAENANQATGH